MSDRTAHKPVAIVTGGARGIGYATVKCLAARGWRAVAADLAPPAGDAEEPPLPAGSWFNQVDVTDSASVDAMVARTMASHGRLDALVNCAGNTCQQLVAELSDDTWRDVLDVHVGGALRCCRAAFPAFKASGGGAVVNFSSAGAHLGRPYRAPYSAAKAGIEGLTRTLAIEWAADRLRVNAVAPGWIATRMVKKLIESGVSRQDELLGHIPLSRLGDPEEIATVVAFLLSPDASYITGQTIIIDGGALINGNW